MANEQAFPAPCEEVLDVENKCPYLPITPTYYQYVQRWVVIPESEGFHLKTRSVMKQLLEDAHSCPYMSGQCDMTTPLYRVHILPQDLPSRRVLHNIFSKVEALRITLNIDGAPIVSRSHTHPSHSVTRKSVVY
jgi:hypothetical protein